MCTISAFHKVIEFDTPDIAVEASASVLRRAIETTNGRMAQVQAERKRRDDAQQKELKEAAEGLKRLQEKYKDGI